MQQLERSPRWQASTTFRSLLALWPQLVGTAVAQHSQPHQIYRGSLQVAVSSAAWAQTLTFERLRILKKIHQRIPTAAAEIQAIRFATARWQQLQRQSELLKVSRLQDHPSWVKASQSTSQALPQTAEEAFRRWSQRIQTQMANQSFCPECNCPCPTQELQRWTVCAICMSHHW